MNKTDNVLIFSIEPVQDLHVLGGERLARSAGHPAHIHFEAAVVKGLRRRQIAVAVVGIPHDHRVFGRGILMNVVAVRIEGLERCHREREIADRADVELERAGIVPYKCTAVRARDLSLVHGREQYRR